MAYVMQMTGLFAYLARCCFKDKDYFPVRNTSPSTRGVFDSIAESHQATLSSLEKEYSMSHNTWKFLEGQTPSGDLIILRPLHVDDADCIGRWRNAEDLRQVLSIDYPVSLTAIQEWLQRAMERKENPTDISLAICLGEKFVGTTGIHDISLRHRHATFGIYVGDEEFRKRGVGRAVYTLLLKYAFNELDLRAVEANVYGDNEPSKSLHERMGFQLVGCKPEWELRNGKYQDFLTYCISKKQWLAMQS